MIAISLISRPRVCGAFCRPVEHTGLGVRPAPPRPAPPRLTRSVQAAGCNHREGERRGDGEEALHDVSQKDSGGSVCWCFCALFCPFGGPRRVGPTRAASAPPLLPPRGRRDVVSVSHFATAAAVDPPPRVCTTSSVCTRLSALEDANTAGSNGSDYVVYTIGRPESGGRGAAAGIEPQTFGCGPRDLTIAAAVCGDKCSLQRRRAGQCSVSVSPAIRFPQRERQARRVPGGCPTPPRRYPSPAGTRHHRHRQPPTGPGAEEHGVGGQRRPDDYVDDDAPRRGRGPQGPERSDRGDRGAGGALIPQPRPRYRT